MNVDILIFAIIALVIAYRLYNTLGTVDDDEGVLVKKTGDTSNVINLDNDQYEVAEDHMIDEEEQKIIDSVDEESQKILRNMKVKDKNFMIKTFLSGAEKAFEIIIAAFVKGDKTALNNLTSKEMAKKFINEFDKLQKLNRKISINIVAIVRNVIESVKINNNIVRISVRLTSEQITVITDKDNKVVSGSKDQIEEIDDVWTFEKNINAKNNMWILSNTES